MNGLEKNPIPVSMSNLLGDTAKSTYPWLLSRRPIDAGDFMKDEYRDTPKPELFIPARAVTAFVQGFVQRSGVLQKVPPTKTPFCDDLLEMYVEATGHQSRHR